MSWCFGSLQRCSQRSLCPPCTSLQESPSLLLPWVRFPIQYFIFQVLRIHFISIQLEVKIYPLLLQIFFHLLHKTKSSLDSSSARTDPAHNMSPRRILDRRGRSTHLVRTKCLSPSDVQKRMIARAMYKEAKNGHIIGLLGHAQSIELFLILSMRFSNRPKTKQNALKAFVGQEQVKPRFSQPKPVKRAVDDLGALISELDSLAAAHYQSCISGTIDDGSGSANSVSIADCLQEQSQHRDQSLREWEDAQVALSLTCGGRLQSLLEEPSRPLVEEEEEDNTVQCLVLEVNALEI